MPASLRTWLAVGTGIGLEIGAQDLEVTIVRVRPQGVRLSGSFTVSGFRQRPAAEWGAEYAAQLKKLGVGHKACVAVLPRREVTVRTLSLPGVEDTDLAPAVAFQADSLHPYPEDQALWTHARLGQSPAVLVGITRRDVLDRYITLFREAGIKVAGFTFAAAVLYSAIRLLRTPPEAGFLAVRETQTGLEIYGESAARPAFSALFDPPWERVLPLALAELRLPRDAEALPLWRILPPPAQVSGEDRPGALSYATALAAACPWLALNANLLPEDQRAASSRLVYVPTAVLATLVLLLAGALAARPALEERSYLRALEQELAKVEPEARKVATLDRQLDSIRARVGTIDDFRRRSQRDLDLLNELTRLLPAPAWLNAADITRTQVSLSGEAEQAAGLLKVLDESPLISESEFTLPIARVGALEAFRIRSQREGAR